MKPEIQSLHNVWSGNRGVQTTANHGLSFSDLTNSIASTGPFYCYIIDFYDMSLSHISASLYEMHGFYPEQTSFNAILEAIHPDDIDFVIKAEDYAANFYLHQVGWEKMLQYKSSYNFRIRLQNDQYVLINHQSLMLTLDDKKGYGKSLNIHTRIDHLSSTPNYKISFIGLNEEPSYMDLNIEAYADRPVSFSKREIDIIKNIAEGLSSMEIAQKLFIAESTVKKHRKNILDKADCSNTAQLVKTCALQGLI
ncbi:helix-turn-helix transcriptional regulator [Taibaiella sp. KBW10]|uniref:LuxR C-terminal-related transcriptional regulator n=1 Tax=Taibaiella sp. KBW10 TaxID=2153357 RepID=UPI000F590CED|nr:LuxR C-terminal-related transcriptional regulator [Taibaiella sp. KBW10]RQO30027.1 helix-turn-helix transcriptional regulator [Taibaiella sp. KBW10]